MTPSLFLLFTCFLASCSCPPLFMFSFSSHLFFLASFLLPLLFWSCLFCLLCCMLFFINSSLWTTTDDILVTAYKRACVCVRVCVCVIRNACDQVSPRTAGLVCMKSSTSVVELVMLLCSQVSFFFFLGELDCSRVSSCMKMSAALKSVWEAFVVIDQPCSMCLSGALQV